MATASLPENPDLDQLRNRARELQRAARRGDPAALARVAQHHPEPPASGSLPLTAAQLVLAREHGFPSWARLRRYVAVVTAAGWTPGAAGPPDEPLADRFLRWACPSGGDDDGAHRGAAARLLDEHPDLPAHSLAVAAACADVRQVRRFLAADPSLATAAPAGPHGWSPLLYQAYARPYVGPDARPDRDATLQTVDALLGAGAGADPNDGQALYNRMFGTDDDHLVLLLEYGLGRGDGGPWHRLLGEALEPPAVMLRNLLWWSVTHDQRDRVALLAANGVDVVSSFDEVRYRGGNGRTPAEVALLNGHRELADQLHGLGAQPPRLRPTEAFVAAVLAGDADGALAADPKVVAAVRRKRTGLVTWAAGQGRRTRSNCSPRPASTSTRWAVATHRSTSPGTPHCTSPRATATGPWPSRCCDSGPIRTSAMRASRPRRSTGPVASSTGRSSTCWNHSPHPRDHPRRSTGATTP